MKKKSNKLVIQDNLLRDLRKKIDVAIKNKDDTSELRIEEKALSQEVGKLMQESRKLNSDIKLYHLHLKQFECCRAVVKQIEEDLLPGEAVVYRDFVACYNSQGHKLQNLVLVLLYRTNIGRPLQSFQLNHYCDNKDSQSNDAYYVADVFEFHLKEAGQGGSGIFKELLGIRKIWLVGDHGSHFSAAATVYNESLFKRLYNIAVLVVFLCSYHAYNRCDGAGTVGVRLAKASTRTRAPVITGRDYTNAVNNSSHFNAVAFTLDEINRGSTRFPEGLSKQKDENSDRYVDTLRKMCELKFDYLDEHGVESREDGVVLCRHLPALPGKKGAPYEVLDLRPNPPGGQVCLACSKMKQRPVRHGDEICPEAYEDLTQVSELKAKLILIPGPDRNRIGEDGVWQRGKQYIKNLKKPRGSHPCSVVGPDGQMCSYHYYNRAADANNHMMKKHSIKEGSAQLYVKDSGGSKQPAKSAAKKVRKNPNARRRRRRRVRGRRRKRRRRRRRKKKKRTPRNSDHTDAVTVPSRAQTGQQGKIAKNASDNLPLPLLTPAMLQSKTHQSFVSMICSALKEFKKTS